MSAPDEAEVRAGTPSDAEAICRIYNAALAERSSTFETEPRSADDFKGRAGGARFPLLVAEAGAGVVG